MYWGGKKQLLFISSFNLSSHKYYKKAKRLSDEALQIAWKEEKWKAKEKRKDIPIWMQNSKE